MSSASGRMFPRDLHQHEEPPDMAGTPVLSASDDAAGAEDACRVGSGRLWREDGRVMYRESGKSEPVAVRVLWARPLSKRGGPVSLMMAAKKREVAYLPSLDVLDRESRRVAEEELAGSMVLPRIVRICEVRPRFGNYYFDVETDKGAKRFLLSSPEVNSYRPHPDTIVIKDVSGNTYEIASVRELDKASRRELERVL